MELLRHPAKRKIGRAGRRSGKTTAAATYALQRFLEGKRILYATPTADQLGRFWYEIKRSIGSATGALYVNETLKVVELPGTEVRIRAHTAWNADTLRGDFCDLLILDEWQMMNEDAWELVGAPMLLDRNGEALFLYTPPSLHSRSVSKARDPRHAARMYQMASEDTTGRWAAFHFTSHDNPHISQQALADISHDMTALAIRQEIMAEDIDEAPGALWTRSLLERYRVTPQAVPPLVRVGIGVDPPGGATECGIIAAGVDAEGHAYVLADGSVRTTPEGWGSRVLALCEEYQADRVLGETNYGGDMVEAVLRGAARDTGRDIPYRPVSATRGKAVRAEPVVAAYERGRVHHVGMFPQLEDELTMWIPGESRQSPNRLDALVWVLTDLIVTRTGRPGIRVLE